MGVAVGSSQWGASNTCCFNAVVGTSGICPALTEPRGTVVVSITYVTFRKLRDSVLVNWVVGVILFSQTSEIPPQSLLELTEKPGKNTSSVSVTMEAAGVSFVPSDVTGVTNEKDTKKSHALTRVYSGSNTSSESHSLTLEPEETTYDNKTGNGSGKNSYRFEGAAVVREAITEGLGHKGLMHISKVLKAMGDSYASRPAIFAISNPAKNAEYTDAFKYAGENKFFASGNPFENVNLGTGTFPNVYILALETPSANGRYCLVERVVHYSELMKSLRNLYPDIRLPEKCADDNPFVPTYLVSKEKSKGLGINYISHEVSLKDTVESLKEKKFICF